MAARALRIAIAARANPGHASGSSLVTERVADGLAARGHEVRRFAPAPGPLPPGDQKAAIRARMAAQHAWLKQEWTGWRPDLIHLEYADDFGHVARQVGRDLGIPATARFHRLHVLAPAAEREGLLAQVLRFHGGAAATVAQSAEQEHWLRQRGVGNATAIENGVDTRRFHPRRRSEPLRARWGAGADDPVLLWAGRILAEKDPLLFAEAAEAARAANPATRAIIAGDGPERERLRERLPWATFAGVLAAEDLADAYASADAFVFTSPPEGIDSWANVVVEAMASGTAPVAYAFGSAAGCVVNGASGRLISLTARADFVAAVAELVRAPTRLRELGAAARTEVAHRTWAACVERYAELFTRVVGATP